MQKFIKGELSRIGLASFSLLLLAVALVISAFLPKLVFGIAGIYGSFFILCLTLTLFLYVYFKIGFRLIGKSKFFGRGFVLSALLLLFWLMLIEAAVY